MMVSQGGLRANALATARGICYYEVEEGLQNMAVLGWPTVGYSFSLDLGIDFVQTDRPLIFQSPHEINDE